MPLKQRVWAVLRSCGKDYLVREQNKVFWQARPAVGNCDSYGRVEGWNQVGERAGGGGKKGPHYFPTLRISALRHLAGPTFIGSPHSAPLQKGLPFRGWEEQGLVSKGSEYHKVRAVPFPTADPVTCG